MMSSFEGISLTAGGILRREQMRARIVMSLLGRIKYEIPRRPLMGTINKSIQIWDTPYVRIAVIVSIMMLTTFSSSIRTAEAPPPTTVAISGKVSGISGTVALEATAKGTTSSLVGKGAGVHINFASEARFTLTGSISGSVVTLTGTVTQAGFAALVGTPVSIVADASTGTITNVFGPIAGGPLAGVTLTFTGTGTVVIN